MRNVYQRCGFKGCSSHSGRRSYGTSMNALGVELRAIKCALGHSDPSMTLEYIDVLDSQLMKASEIAL
ncbi:tyrosine-type recombinase/integrase [Vibrio vulnificus]|uniref:tyrosine-type recombinase/integrase n=1 Tax=Vibrio vulnificus TaxID=672 RepID=UPI001EEF4415|nr:tyrosine-type recombinase/integrase [Vibrio vulnificus]